MRAGTPPGKGRRPKWREVGHEPGDRRVLRSHAEGRRLTDRQRRKLGVGCRDERDDTAVGVTNDVIAGLRHLEQLASLNVEVDVLEWRIRRIAGARRHDERVALGERGAAQATSCRLNVDENEPRAGSRDLPVPLVP